MCVRVFPHFPAPPASVPAYDGIRRYKMCFVARLQLRPTFPSGVQHSGVYGVCCIEISRRQRLFFVSLSGLVVVGSQFFSRRPPGSPRIRLDGKWGRTLLYYFSPLIKRSASDFSFIECTPCIHSQDQGVEEADGKRQFFNRPYRLLHGMARQGCGLVRGAAATALSQLHHTGRFQQWIR